jgi:hypothetical protein
VSSDSATYVDNQKFMRDHGGNDELMNVPETIDYSADWMPGPMDGWNGDIGR